MAESRGKEDMRLKAEFEKIYRGGTENLPHAFFVARFTSSQLKVKPKSANVAGLQGFVVRQRNAAYQRAGGGSQPGANRLQAGDS
jgi:hypothetical protein